MRFIRTSMLVLIFLVLIVAQVSPAFGQEKVNKEVMSGTLASKLMTAQGDGTFNLIVQFKDTVTDGDIAVLEALDIEVRQVFQAFPQRTVNVQVGEKRPIEELAGVTRAMADAETKLGSNGRLLVRYSGTENIARVMVEGEDEDMITELANSIEAAFESELG